MKKTILNLTILAFMASGCGQTKQQDKENVVSNSITTTISDTENNNNSLEEMIIETIKAYQNQDEETLNSLVLKDFGIAFVHRPGAIDDIVFSDKISFNNPVPDYYPYDVDIEIDCKINFETLPDFDCGTEKWSKPHGIYCDTTSRSEQLSAIAKFRNEYTESNFSAAEIKNIEEVEKASHKVIVLGKKGNYFKFFLTFKENKWYLTIIDRTDYCSA